MQHISVTASAHPQHKDITLISVKGFIDTNTAPEFEKTFQTVLGQQKFNLIIDLKEASYISSAGWGIFVGEIKRIRTQKGDLFLVSMNPAVTEAYELLQFSTILKSFLDVEQAVQKGFKRTRAAKGLKTPVVKNQANSEDVLSIKIDKSEMSLEEPSMDNGMKKTHWYFRILQPWKWF